MVKRSKKKVKCSIPEEIAKNKVLLKFWHKRFTLFSKFDKGILLDEESWFSVTPEDIALHIAQNMKHLDVIVDGFCGCGGNSIQFAKFCKKVIAIDIDANKVRMAKHNAKIYNVHDKIDFIIGDFLKLSNSIKADGVFLSPPWGGPSYSQVEVFDIDKDIQPISTSQLFDKTRKISSNITIFLPKNSNVLQLLKLAGKGNKVKIEKNLFNDKIVALTAYYGKIG